MIESLMIEHSVDRKWDHRKGLWPNGTSANFANLHFGDDCFGDEDIYHLVTLNGSHVIGRKTFSRHSISSKALCRKIFVDRYFRRQILRRQVISSKRISSTDTSSTERFVDRYFVERSFRWWNTPLRSDYVILFIFSPSEQKVKPLI